MGVVKDSVVMMCLKDRLNPSRSSCVVYNAASRAGAILVTVRSRSCRVSRCWRTCAPIAWVLTNCSAASLWSAIRSSNSSLSTGRLHRHSFGKCCYDSIHHGEEQVDAIARQEGHDQERFCADSHQSASLFTKELTFECFRPIPDAPAQTIEPPLREPVTLPRSKSRTVPLFVQTAQVTRLQTCCRFRDISVKQAG